MADESDTLSNQTPIPSEWGAESASVDSLLPHAIFQLALLTVIFIVGFFGNCIVIYGILQQGSSKTTSSCLIANLALSDLAVLVLSLPVCLLQELASWPFGEIACKVFFPLGDVFLAVSIMTLTAIALDRYRAIVTPFKDRYSKRQAKLCIFMIWLLCYLVVGMPMSFILKLVTMENGEKICYPFWNNDTQRRIHRVLIASLVTLPLFLIGFCYFRVVFALWKVQTIHRESTKNSITMMRLEQKRKLVKMLVVIVIAFSVCLLPYIIYALLLEFAGLRRSGTVNIGLVAVLSLLYANSAINPLILCSMSKDYRKGLRPCGC